MLIRLLSIAILVFSPVISLAITIDEFEGDQELEAGPGVSVSDVITVPLAPGGLRSTAIGGTRELILDGLTGSTDLETDSGILEHSQNFGTTGNSTVIWDGDLDTSELNHTGLGGVDFTHDGSSLVRITLAFDSGFDQPISFDLIFYSSANRYSIYTVTLIDDVTTFSPIDIPYTDFTKHPSAVEPASFNSIGAIKLVIHGLNEANDLGIESITTDVCPHVPDANLKVIDECGVCNGDNSTCADCLGVPNGSSLPGTACDNQEQGVCNGGTFNQNCICERNTDPSDELCDGLDNDCDGDVDEAFPMLGETCGVGSGLCEFKGTYVCDQAGVGLTCDDQGALQQLVDQCEASKGCDGVPNSGLVVDQCGICGGNGTSCADCKGVPYGTATVDRCGECNGNGDTCLDCDSYDQRDLLNELDGGSIFQERHIKRINRMILKKSKRSSIKKFVKKANKKAHQLHLQNWTLSWTLPEIVTQCENLNFCIERSNKPIVDQYRGVSRDLKRLGTRSIRKLSKITGKKFRKLTNKNENLDARNQILANTVPVSQSVCS